MTVAALSDFARIDHHRAIWKNRPELRAVYHEWFRNLLDSVDGLSPIVEVGAGPGFFKEYHSDLITTDVLVTPWIDVASDAAALPFRSGSVGAIVMVDVLHHLTRPLQFMAEARRVLKTGGRLAMIEPWITPFSFVVYRYFHDEQCRLNSDLDCAFDKSDKKAFDGNAAIPYQLLKRCGSEFGSLVLRDTSPFLALPYLASLGFKRERPLSSTILRVGTAVERLLGPVGKLNATRIRCVWEKEGRKPVWRDDDE